MYMYMYTVPQSLIHQERRYVHVHVEVVFQNSILLRLISARLILMQAQCQHSIVSATTPTSQCCGRTHGLFFCGNSPFQILVTPFTSYIYILIVVNTCTCTQLQWLQIQKVKYKTEKIMQPSLLTFSSIIYCVHVGTMDIVYLYIYMYIHTCTL